MQSLWMVVAALFYAFYAVFVKYSGFEGIGSWEILFFRSIFGVVLFYGVMRFSGITLSTTHPWQHLIRSMCGTLSIICGIYSVSHLNIGLAMTLNYTSPLFVGAYILTTSLLHHARVNWGLMAMVLFGFIGVVIMLGPTIGPHEYYAAVVGLAGASSLQMPQHLLRNSACFMSRKHELFFTLFWSVRFAASSEHSSPAASIPGALRAPYTFWDFVSVRPAVNSV